MPPWLSTLWLCVCCLWGSGESRAQGQGGEGAQGIRGHGERWLSHALHLPPLPPTHTHTHTHTLNQAHTHTLSIRRTHTHTHTHTLNQAHTHSENTLSHMETHWCLTHLSVSQF